LSGKRSLKKKISSEHRHQQQSEKFWRETMSLDINTATFVPVAFAHLHDPLEYHGTATTLDERNAKGLRGFLPVAVHTFAQQVS
jgi:hypothetical protein